MTNVLQLLVCRRAGQTLAVPVGEIDSIERTRLGQYPMHLAEHSTGARLGVDSVGGVIEVPREELVAPPPRIARAASRVIGVARVEGQAILVVHSGFLAREGSIEVPWSPAVKRSSVPISGPIPETNEPRLLTFMLSVDGPESRSVVVGIPLEQIVAAVEPSEWVPFEGSDGVLRGIVPWRGRSASLVDLSAALGMGRSEDSTTGRRMLIVRGTAREEPVALRTDAATQRIAPELAEQIEPASLGFTSRVLRGAFRWRDATLVVPDFDALV
jgi:chemotaxis signal transduction protein